MSARAHVLVLCGGPDAEREVSLKGGAAVADAINATREYSAEKVVIDRVTTDDLRAMRADVIWPLLHGPWGEGGPMQDILEADGRPFVGCGPTARSRWTNSPRNWPPPAPIFSFPAAGCSTPATTSPHPLPLVLKPNFEGSTIGLHICRRATTGGAPRPARASGRVSLVEPFIRGRELTAGLLDSGDGLTALPLIEITPKDGFYDYEAKYIRNDTRYVVEPEIDPWLAHDMQRAALTLARELGVRHLARADFILPHEPVRGNTVEPVLLEINTMPGFTDHSLVPMAARHIGLEMPDLCAQLVRCALRDHAGAIHT